MKIRKILLATDFSACSWQAFAPAADLARRLGAFIDLVNCLAHPPRHTRSGQPQTNGSLEDLRRLHRRNLELQAEDPAFKGVPVTAHLLEGMAPEAVVDYAVESETDLIVQSSHGLTDMRRLLLGSFAERLLRISPLPVLTFPSGSGPRQFRPRRIVFPYDFSPAAGAALETVKFLAATYGAKLLVLHAAKVGSQMLPLYAGEGIAVDLGSLPGGEGVPSQLLGNLEEFAGRELRVVDHEEEVVVGDPASVILSRSAEENADLICMPTHGRTGLQRLFLGSMAEKVLRESPCPTWVVHAGYDAQNEKSRLESQEPIFARVPAPTARSCLR